MPSASCDPRRTVLTPSYHTLTDTPGVSHQPNLWNVSEGLEKAQPVLEVLNEEYCLCQVISCKCQESTKEPGSHPDSCLIPAPEGLPVLRKPPQPMTLLSQPTPASPLPSAWQQQRPATGKRTTRVPRSLMCRVTAAPSSVRTDREAGRAAQGGAAG